jgi:hypothetical protein
MEKIEDALRKLPVEGFICLHIRAVNTKNNSEIHEAFRQFAKAECDDNYTIALKTLMGGFNSDSNYVELADKVAQLNAEVIQLTARIAELEHKNSNKDDEDGTF